LNFFNNYCNKLKYFIYICVLYLLVKIYKMSKSSKDIGTCLRQIGKLQINRSKYKNAKDAQDKLDELLAIEVINKDYVVYKCPTCHTWHMGLKKWENKLF